LYLQVAAAAEQERIYNYLVILKIHIFICMSVFVSAFVSAQQQQWLFILIIQKYPIVIVLAQEG